jgi:adenylate kinase
MNIIVNGPQGSGKSTQAKLIADKYNLNLVDSGDALRHIPDEKLEAELKSFMDKGEWIPEQLYFKVFDAFVAKNFDKNKGFVLSSEYEWSIEEDDHGEKVLIPKRTIKL